MLIFRGVCMMGLGISQVVIAGISPVPINSIQALLCRCPCSSSCSIFSTQDMHCDLAVIFQTFWLGHFRGIPNNSPKNLSDLGYVTVEYVISIFHPRGPSVARCQAWKTQHPTWSKVPIQRNFKTLEKSPSPPPPPFSWKNGGVSPRCLSTAIAFRGCWNADAFLPKVIRLAHGEGTNLCQVTVGTFARSSLIRTSNFYIFGLKKQTQHPQKKQ